MQKFIGYKFLLVLGVSVCLTGTVRAAVVIQEVLYDGPGTDSDDVFTELFGTPGTSLDGWSLVGINGNDGMSYRVIDLSGETIPADGIFLIVASSANAALAPLSDFVANVDWQNGPDALQLFDGMNLVDAVQYGDAGIYNAGEGGFAMDVAGELSLSRDLLGTDTNDNAIDFSATTPTPGAGVSVVPIPAAAWLLASGLGLLGLLRTGAGPRLAPRLDPC